jgi:DNA-binding NtrC family response regulator
VQARGSIVTQKHSELRVLIVGPAHVQAEFQRQLADLHAAFLFVSCASDLSRLVRNLELIHVVVLPIVLLNVNWWALWNEICLLNPRPALLVYTHTASFQLWSSVLESGGYDVIVEPFMDEELQGAVLRAARSLEGESQDESRDFLGE